MASNKTKEPTNQEIMYEIKRTHVITILSLYFTVFVVGVGLLVSNTYPAAPILVWLVSNDSEFYLLLVRRYKIRKREK